MNAKPPRGRLGFAVMVGEDGNLAEELLIGLKATGYDGIEPNCYRVRHLAAIIERCRNVGLAIHALPTGRWMSLAEAREDYDRYTQHVLEVLSEGAVMAQSRFQPAARRNWRQYTQQCCGYGRKKTWF